MVKWHVLLVVLGAIVAGCGGESSGNTQPASSGAQVYLAWLAHWDTTVTGYRVYYGPTLDNVAPIRDMPVPQTNAVFDTINDLRAAIGAQLCFRLTAINAYGESPMTDGVCVTLS